MKENSRYGSKNSRPYILSAHKAINLDGDLDFLLAEQMMLKKAKNEK